MPPTPAFVPSHVFTSTVLPGLLPDTRSLTHVVASYRRIGFVEPPTLTEIVRGNGLATVRFHDLTHDRVHDEVPRILRTETDGNSPLLATVYAGPTGFLRMVQLIAFLLEERPDAQIVAAACACIGDDQEEILLAGARNGTIAALVWAECGGSHAMRNIDRSVKANWTPATANVRPYPLSANSADLGA